MSNATIAPVRRTVFVQAPPERAFEVFTEHVGSWWPASHSLLERQEAVVVEPAEGGRWYERGPSGEECDWGRVLAYEPPRRLVLSWLLDERFDVDPDESKASEVEVAFIPEGGGTRVELVHSGFERRGEGGEGVAAGVAGENGWSGLLAAYAEAAQASS